MNALQIDGMPLNTKKLASTDTAAGLPTVYMGATATKITETGWTRPANRALVTCDVNSIRYTFNGVTPTNDAGTATGHVLTTTSDPLLLTSEEQIRQFQIISKTAGAHATLQVTPFIAAR